MFTGDTTAFPTGTRNVHRWRFLPSHIPWLASPCHPVVQHEGARFLKGILDVHLHTHTHTHTQTYARTCTRTHIHTHTNICTHMHTYTHKHIHLHPHTPTPTPTPTHTHTHTHTLSFVRGLSVMRENAFLLKVQFVVNTTTIRIDKGFVYFNGNC